MTVYFENAVEVKADSRWAALRMIEGITAQPQDRWIVAAPSFKDGTARRFILLREYDDEPELKTWYECYENPADRYVYFVTTFMRGALVDKLHIVKYAWE